MNHLVESFENKILGEKYYKIRHASGLTVFVYPKNMSTAYALFSTKYGALERTFRVEGETEMLTVPDGVAHFLEHKLFEEVDGSDVFAKFAALGASANAFTSHEMTSYLFSATDRVTEALEILLRFVREPHFTDENVKKEQGIIGQEIGMYDDRPASRLFYALLEGLYREHNVRINIAGTVESIAKITPELLYRCYHTFYRPSNMVLSVCGNVTPEEVMAVVDRVLPKEEEPMTVELSYPTEPKELASPYTELAMSVAKPLFAFGVKDLATFASPTERYRHMLLVNLLSRCYFSKSSHYYNELYDSALVNGSLDSFYDAMNTCAYFGVMGESDDPKTVFEKTVDLFKNIRENMPSEAEFLRMKRIAYATYVRNFDSTEEIARSLTEHYFHGTELFAASDVLSSITYEEFVSFALHYFEDKEFALAVVRPTDEEKENEIC
ncbi:MAG: insulinase family protein [Clostridia bacterium]|nr:insulinase family protein [Clostridia bacterium]